MYRHTPTPVSTGRVFAATIMIIVIGLLGGTTLALQGTYLTAETAHIFAARSLGVIVVIFLAACWVIRQMGVRG